MVSVRRLQIVKPPGFFLSENILKFFILVLNGTRPNPGVLCGTVLYQACYQGYTGRTNRNGSKSSRN